MPRKASGQEKAYIIRQKRPNGDVYLLERKVVYDPETRQNKVLGTQVVGKIKKWNGRNDSCSTQARRETAEST